jgi:hypothetical protein
MSSSRCYILKLNTRLKTKKPPIDKFSSQLIRTQITKNLHRSPSKSLRNKNNVENDKFLNINVKQQRSTLPCIITQKTKNSWHKAENNQKQRLSHTNWLKIQFLCSIQLLCAECTNEDASREQRFSLDFCEVILRLLLCMFRLCFS